MRSLTLSLLLAIVLGIHAAEYRTQRLGQLAQAAALRLDSVEKQAVDTAIYNGRQLHIMADKQGRITHIGYALFAPELLVGAGQADVLRFVERHLLEADLLPKEKGRPEAVVVTEGRLNMVSEITPETPFDIEILTRRAWRIGWTIGEKRLTLSFPADCQLIYGANAIELEDLVEREIAAQDSTDLLTDWSKEPAQGEGETLVCRSGQYLSELIRSDVMLKATGKKHKERQLMIDEKSPTQSVRNLLLTGEAGRTLPMTLTLNRYGHRQTVNQVSLQQFVRQCQAEGCTLYVGVKTKDDGHIMATVFAYNEALAYNHVLSVTVPTSILGGGSEPLTATLYAYIPLQNVSEKFFTQDLKPQ